MGPSALDDFWLMLGPGCDCSGKMRKGRVDSVRQACWSGGCACTPSYEVHSNPLTRSSTLAPLLRRRLLFRLSANSLPLQTVRITRNTQNTLVNVMRASHLLDVMTII